MTIAAKRSPGQYSRPSGANVTGSSPGDVAGLTGWPAVRVVSPRPRVRVAAVDEHTGRALNEYPGTVSVRGAEPSVPYAMHLAVAGKYRMLAFDLDAAKASPTVVLEDLAQLRVWLAAAGIPCMVAASGPGGGRHVWAAIAGKGAESGRVAVLARALAARLPTLDIAPLCNPDTGCVRPPGAPHRAPGWSSTVVEGAWDVLLEPVATPASVEALLEIVGPAPTPVARRSGPVSTRTDPDGHPYVVGPHRALPARSRLALESPLVGDVDASAQVWTVLLGAARARWRFAQVAELLPTAPGLEHARSAHTARSLRRDARPAVLQLRLLERQWARAVSTVANSPASDGDGADDEFMIRLQTVLDDVAQLQARADACPSRWSRPGGPADRRVLDHACLMALTGVCTGVDLDIRSVAMATGIGRETARTALHRLAIDGWLSQITPAVGPLAATWALGPAPSGVGIAAGQQPALSQESMIENPPSGISTDDLVLPRSHVVPPPDGGPAPKSGGARSPAELASRRAAWSARLQHRISAQAHDCFIGTAQGLGHHAGAVFAALETLGEAAGGWVSLEGLTEQTGRSTADVLTLLSALAGHRLARPGPSRPGGVEPTWSAGSRRHRTRAAQALGSDGALAARRRRVAVDRQVWAWWLAELDWMHTRARDRPEYRSSRHGRSRQPGPGQQTLPLPAATTARHRFGPYPRHAGRGGSSGRADHAVARSVLEMAQVVAA